MTLWIKICANTSLADAQLAAQAGADAVGFVFAPSPRQVTPAQAAAIVPHLPAALEKIGVFVDAAFEEISATVEAAGLTGVQLHWDAPHSLPAQLRERFGPKAAHPGRGALRRNDGGQRRGPEPRSECRCDSRQLAHGIIRGRHGTDLRLGRGAKNDFWRRCANEVRCGRRTDASQRRRGHRHVAPLGRRCRQRR